MKLVIVYRKSNELIINKISNIIAAMTDIHIQKLLGPLASSVFSVRVVYYCLYLDHETYNIFCDLVSVKDRYSYLGHEIYYGIFHDLDTNWN